MNTLTKKFTVTFKHTPKAPAGRTFFELAKKHILKKKKGKKTRYSENVDSIVYGV